MTPATADDVLASFKRYADASGLAALLTGGWHHERPPAGAVMPYAIAKCEEGDKVQWYGGQMVTFKMSVEVRSQEGLHDRRAIARELAKFDRNRALTLPDTDAQIIHCLPGSGKLTNEQQHQSRDVALSVGAWDVLVSQPRPSVTVGIGVGDMGIGDDTEAAVLGVTT